MYKLLKNKSKKNLHSDAELKGRGMRTKLQNNEDNNTQGLFSNLSSDSDNSEGFRLSVQQKSSSKHQLDYPNFPLPPKKKVLILLLGIYSLIINSFF